VRAKRQVPTCRDSVECFKAGLRRRTFCAANAPREKWPNLGETRGHLLGTVPFLADHVRGEGWLAEVKGDHQGVWGWPWWTRVTREPADRTCEGRPSPRRQEETLGSTQLVAVWPLPAFAPRMSLVMGGRDIGAPRNWTSVRSRCTRSRRTPKTATAKGAVRHRSGGVRQASVLKWPNPTGSSALMSWLLDANPYPHNEPYP
jgi:hypothetical protein